MSISIKKLIGATAAAGMMFAAVLVAPAASVAQAANGAVTPTPASSAAPASTPGATPKTAKIPVTDARIEQIYASEQKALATQGTNLNNSGKLIGQVQTRIDALKAKGKNVAPLQQALADFRLMLPDARAAHKTAADILSQHAGFDVSGQITTRADALETIRDAGQALRDARRLYTQAAQDLRTVLRQYRNA